MKITEWKLFSSLSWSDVPGLVLELRQLHDGGAGLDREGDRDGDPGCGLQRPDLRPGQLPHQLLLQPGPEFADLPAGGGEVALQLEFPLSQSETEEFLIIIKPSPPSSPA